MIDTHAHLNFEAFKDDYEEVIKRAQEEGVEAMINVGSNLETSEKAVELAKKFACCWAAVGVHPIHGEDTRILGYEEIKRKLKKLARHKKVVAVGETGLDYFQIKSPRPRRGDPSSTGRGREAEGGLIKCPMPNF